MIVGADSGGGAEPAVSSQQSSKWKRERVPDGRIGDLVWLSQLALLVLLVWHLWTIWGAAQERSAYERMLAPLQGSSAAWWAGRMLMAAVLLYALLPRPRRTVQDLFTRGSSRSRLAAFVAVFGALFLVLHVIMMGGLTRQLIEYDVLCALLSSTSWGIPAWALVHVLGVSAVGGHLSLVVHARAARAGWRHGGWLSALVFVLVFCVGTAAVLRFATGSSAPLVL